MQASIATVLSAILFIWGMSLHREVDETLGMRFAELSFFLVALFVGPMLWIISSYRLARRLYCEGACVDAVVVAHRAVGLWASADFIGVEFADPAGVRYEARYVISAIFRQIEMGTQLRAFFDPRRPKWVGVVTPKDGLMIGRCRPAPPAEPDFKPGPWDNLSGPPF